MVTYSELPQPLEFHAVFIASIHGAYEASNASLEVPHVTLPVAMPSLKSLKRAFCRGLESAVIASFVCILRMPCYNAPIASK